MAAPWSPTRTAFLSANMSFLDTQVRENEGRKGTIFKNHPVWHGGSDQIDRLSEIVRAWPNLIENEQMMYFFHHVFIHLFLDGNNPVFKTMMGR